MYANFISALRSAEERSELARHALADLGAGNPSVSSSAKRTPSGGRLLRRDVFVALESLSASLASSYAQAVRDLEDPERLTWAGPGHEIREVLRGILELLAPDEQVVAQPWFRREDNTSGPTQRQKALYILRQRDAGSKEEEVVKQVMAMDDVVSGLVRATYLRASDAAHRSKSRREIIRILNYFHALAHDLLDLE